MFLKNIYPGAEFKFSRGFVRYKMLAGGRYQALLTGKTYRVNRNGFSSCFILKGARPFSAIRVGQKFLIHSEDTGDGIFYRKTNAQIYQKYKIRNGVITMVGGWQMTRHLDSETADWKLLRRKRHRT